MAGEPIPGTDRRRPGLFDPGGGGILGAIGAIQGLPTREEAEVLAQEARIGGARQEAFSALANEIQKAQGDVSRGVVNFFNTEAGQNVFANDPGFLEEAQRMLRFAQQPAETQARQDLAQQADEGEGSLQQLAQAEIQRRMAVAQNKLQEAQQGGGTEAERAWATLVDAGQASELDAAAAIAGATKVIQKRDRFGALKDEYVKVNTLTNERTPITATGGAEQQALTKVAEPEPLEGQQQQQAQQTQVGQTPQQEQARDDALTRSLEEGGEAGAQVIRAAGAVPMALRIFSGIGGQVDPKFAKPTQTARANAARILENEFVVMQRQAGDRLPADQLERVRDTISQIGAFKSPTDAGQRLLQVHNFLDRAMKAELTTIQDERLAEETRVNASNSFAAMRRFKSLMPAREDIQAELSALENEDPVELAKQQLEQVTGGEETPEGGVAPGPGGGPPAGDIRDETGRLPAQAGQRPESPAPGVEPGAGEAGPRARVPGPPPAATLTPEERAAAQQRFKGMELPGPVLQAIDTIQQTDRETAEFLSPVVNYASGFNAALVETLGVAPEAVNEAFQLLGQDGFWENPGDATEAMKAALEDVGAEVADENVDTLATRMGRASFNAAVSTGALLAGAPHVAAQRKSTVAAEIASGTRELVTRHPRIFFAGEAGAVAGGEAAEPIAESIYGPIPESLDPVLRTSGSLLFGLLPAAIPGMSRITFRRDLKDESEGALGEVRAGDVPEGADAPQVDLSVLRASAEQATEADRQLVNNTIRATINRFAPGALGNAQRRAINPEKAVLNIRRGLRRALDGPIRKKERQLWGKVDQSASMKPRVSKITEHVNKMVNSTPQDVRNSNLPMPIIRKIQAWKGRDSLTVKDVKAVAANLSERVRNGQAVNNAQLGAMKNISRKLYNEIERANPKDKAMHEARAFSMWLNDRLTRGPIGKLISNKEPLDPDQALDEISRKFRPDEGGGAQPLAGVIGEVAAKAPRPSLIRDAESFVRNRFGQIAQQLDEAPPAGRPTQSPAQREGEVRRQQAISGRKFLNDPRTRRWQEAAPKVIADAQITQRNLADALEQQAAIEASAWSKFSNADPQEAVRNLMASPNKIEDAMALMRRLREDKDALQAFRVGLTDWLYQGIEPTEAAPSRILQRLNQRDTREVFKVAWGEGRVKRIDDILEAGASRERGELPMLTQIGQFGTRRAAQVGGAFLGRLLNTGTIQTPGILSAASANVTQRMMKPFSPARMTAQALMDPQWERFLLSKVPRNLDEARRKVKVLGSLAGQVTAGTNLLNTPEAQDRGEE